VPEQVGLLRPLAGAGGDLVELVLDVAQPKAAR